ELRRLTGGNPFYLDEVIRTALADPEEGRHLRLRGKIPSRAREALRERIALLSQPAREVVAAAAVLGDVFARDLLASICEPEETGIDAALAEAGAAGLVVPLEPGGRFAFRHALVREALYETLGTGRRVELHRLAGDALEAAGSTSPEDVFALAHHRFAAAQGGERFLEAVDSCERAGRLALAQLGYEEAVRELGRAAGMLERLPRDDRRRMDLLLVLADALLAAGDRVTARETYFRAAELARAVADAEALARAAVGFAGGTGLELEEEERIIGLLDESLAGLGDADPRLRLRVLDCLAIVLDLTRSDPRAERLSAEGLAIARRLGDPVSLAHALNSRCLVLSGPDHVEERLRLADEVLDHARRAGLLEMEIGGRFTRIAAALEFGDVATADREIAAYGQAAEKLRRPAYLWQVPLFAAMRALLAGRFADAERLAEEALRASERGKAAQGPILYLVQLFEIRRAQGRLAELEPALRALALQYPAIAAFRTGLALVYAELGREAEARAELERLAANDFTDLPRDRNWMNAMEELAETCAFLGDRPRAARLYELLLPFAERNVMVAFASACHGSVSRLLGLLAATLGRWSEAGHHFERALERNRAFGAEVLLARTELDYAEACLCRGDPESARRLVDRAASTVETLAVAGLSSRVTALREAMSRPATARLPDAAAPRVPVDGAANLFRRDGDGWSIRYRGRAFTLRDTSGLRYIAVLLGSPGREIAATGLEAAAGADRRGGAPCASPEALAERARINVTKRIRAGIRRIAAHDPALGHYLRGTIRTGVSCSYRVDSADAVAWIL
ncbi:MAG: tetratricopeptide repeat protein, partial [Candidatus Binatia bacterium]